MAIELTEKFAPYTDELFATESKISLITNNDFDFTGARTVRVYKVSTAAMNNYKRTGDVPAGQWSRYGVVQSLDATTEDFTLTRDRAFTFEIDKLDADETAQQLSAASALARQLRLVVVPEADAYTYGAMCAGADAGKTEPLTPENLYGAITEASEALDDVGAPETGRFIIMPPTVYRVLKKNPDIVDSLTVADELRMKGVVAILDGANVIRVPSSKLPENFGFLMGHPSATVAPTKLADYTTHENPPGINGSLVEGRVVYDAFVLDNKASALYYHVNEAEPVG
jgi:hypothetical protein